MAEEPKVALADGTEYPGIVDIEYAEHGVADDEWRADRRTDLPRDDRLRQGDLVVLRVVDEGHDLAPLHYFVQQRAADQQVGRVTGLGAPQMLKHKRRAVRAEERNGGAGGMQELDDLVENEVEQLAHGAVFEESQSQGRKDPRAQLGAARLAFIVDADDETRGLRVAVDGHQLRSGRRRQLLVVKQNLRVAEGDAIAAV